MYRAPLPDTAKQLAMQPYLDFSNPRGLMLYSTEAFAEFLRRPLPDGVNGIMLNEVTEDKQVYRWVTDSWSLVSFVQTNIDRVSLEHIIKDTVCRKLKAALLKHSTKSKFYQECCNLVDNWLEAHVVNLNVPMAVHFRKIVRMAYPTNIRAELFSEFAPGMSLSAPPPSFEEFLGGLECTDD